MRIAVLFFASTALAGAAALSGCGDGGMTGRSATTSTTSQRAAAAQPSADIRESQQQLKSLGYYDGQVDGLWGPETQGAVERYQRERGLSASGRIDAATRESLRETTAGRSGTTTGTGGMTAGRDPQAPVTLTSETDVRTVQNRLAQLNFYQGQANGIWGSETQAAVENFQRARGLPAGQLNLATLNAMGLDSIAAANQRPAATQTGSTQVGGVVDNRSGAGTAAGRVPPEANIAPSAGPGAGARAISPRSLTRVEVRNVQQRLADKGHYRASIDGVWGPQSEQALVNFQTQNGLRNDGQIDPPTANALGIDLQRLGSGSSRGSTIGAARPQQ